MVTDLGWKRLSLRTLDDGTVLLEIAAQPRIAIDFPIDREAAEVLVGGINVELLPDHIQDQPDYIRSANEGDAEHSPVP